MEIKILFGGAIFLGGWLWCYLFIRQLMFNFQTAYPLIKKMRSLDEGLIAVGAGRYTTVSVAVCLLVSLIVLFVIIRFCAVYLMVSFLAGAFVAFVMLLGRMRPENKPVFESFCRAYYRFVPDDVLRTEMYNNRVGKMKARLKEMGIEDSFIPSFKDN